MRNGAQPQREYYLGNTNLPTPTVKIDYTAEQVVEMNKCMDDILYFAENYFYITELGRGKQKICLYKPQKRVLKSLMKNRFVACLASRQSGKTTYLTIYALWTACFFPDKRTLIVANKEDTSIMILRRIRMAYEMLPNWLKPGVKQWGKTEIIFGNDSSIAVSTTTGTAARGESVNNLIVDEMAFIQEHLIEPFWKSVVPIISSDSTGSSKIFIVSTPNGAQGLFYKIFTDAERGVLKNWTTEKINWDEIPRQPTPKKWKEQMLEALGGDETAFAQEFGNVFVEYGKTAIDTELLQRMKAKVKKPQIVFDDGDYKIWNPPEPGRIYSMGCDVSEGVEGNASCIQIFDITDLTNIVQCAVYKNSKIDPSFFANKVHQIAQQWGMPFISIERNGPGAETLNTLFNVHHYDGLVSILPEGQKKMDRFGIYSHTSLKYKAVMNMRYWVNNLEVVKINDAETIQELETFVQQGNNVWKKKAGSTYHDDLVMSMVWSLFVLDPGTVTQYFEVIDYDQQGKPLKITYSDQSRFDNFKFDPNLSSKSEYVGEIPMYAYFGGADNIGAEEDWSQNDLFNAGWRPARREY